MIDYDKIISLVHGMKPIIFDESLKSDVMLKGAADFVTRVDLSISGALKSKLVELYPDIGFMSEEEKNTSLPDPRWILDPIDGTANLVFGLNTSSVSLALLEHGEVVFGVVYDPYREETFHAVKGQGAWLNSKKLPVLDGRPLKDSIIEFGAGYTDKINSKANFSLALDVFEHAMDLRRMCSTALAICYIAAGRLDGYFEKKIKPWDYAAAGLILEECGGRMSGWQGERLGYTGQCAIVCGSRACHGGLLEIIAKHIMDFVS